MVVYSWGSMDSEALSHCRKGFTFSTKKILYIFKEGLLLPPKIEKILDLSEYRGRFRKWLLDELIIRYPRKLNSLRFRDTIYLKGKGLRNSALDVLSAGSR